MLQPETDATDVAKPVFLDEENSSTTAEAAMEIERGKSAGSTRSFPNNSRLHIATLWLPATELAIGSIVPVMIGSLFVGPVAPIAFLGFLVFVAVFHAIRYHNLRYRVDEAELAISSGILTKRERRIPLDRIQELKLHQGVIHRLFGFARLQISTAGSDTHEATLDALTLDAAEQLKNAVASKQVSAASTQVAGDSLNSSNYTFDIDLRTLVLGGVTSKAAAFVGAIVGVIVYFQAFGEAGRRFKDWIPSKLRERIHLPGQETIESFEAMVPDSGVTGFVAGLWLTDNFWKSLLFATGGVLVAVGAYVFRYYAFRLERTGDRLSTSHGLLTYQHGGLRRTRIQALKLEEGLLRRWCGLATLRVDSAGDHTEVDEQKKRDVLVPVLQRSDAENVASQVVPNLASMDPAWTRVSPLAISRGCKKGWLIASLAMLLAASFAGWYSLLLIPAFPLIYLLNERWYRHTGYCISEEYLLYRSGWLQRSTICIPTNNVQSVALRQSYFDRRLQLASLHVDIAGQSNTGGGPRIRNLPLEQAQRMQSQLAMRAATTDFNW